MNPKQKRFADEYLIDLNGTQAAIRCGYSAKTAAEQASRLLTDVRITAYIKERGQTIADKLGINAEYVLGTTKGICDRTKNHDPKNALKAVDMLGKHLKLWQDDDKKLQQNITINILDF